ncbi:MAG: hypothetical protein QM270_11495 [Bacillota bacterium]|nr:hypothetical protein [Bacillota bacterium]
MLNWLAEHWGSIVILLALLTLAVVTTVRHLHPGYRQQSGCAGCRGCQMPDCPSAGKEGGQGRKRNR